MNSRLQRLDPLQLAILTLAAQGCSYEEIAETFGKTTATIRWRARDIFEILKVDNFRVATSIAISAGTITPFTKDGRTKVITADQIKELLPLFGDGVKHIELDGVRLCQTVLFFDLPHHLKVCSSQVKIELSRSITRISHWTKGKGYPAEVSNPATYKIVEGPCSEST